MKILALDGVGFLLGIFQQGGGAVFITDNEKKLPSYCSRKFSIPSFSKGVVSITLSNYYFSGPVKD